MRGDYGFGSQGAGYVLCQLVGSADVSRKHGDDVAAGTVDADHGGVGVLVLDIGGDAAYADAHGSNEEEGVEAVEMFFQEKVVAVYRLAVVCLHRGADKGRLRKFVYKLPGYAQTFFRYEENRCFHANANVLTLKGSFQDVDGVVVVQRHVQGRIELHAQVVDTRAEGFAAFGRHGVEHDAAFR